MDYVVCADNFCEKNTNWGVLFELKKAIPNFKINLLTLTGRISIQFAEDLKKIDWIDLIPCGWAGDVENECLQWSHDRASKYLRDTNVYGLTKGFMAPSLEISDGMYLALKEAGYFVIDRPENAMRRPVGLQTYIPDNTCLMYHIGHYRKFNLNEIGKGKAFLKSLNGNNFNFIKDLI
jgi:hypothetical protein